MYDQAHPAVLGARDVIAAWLVCFAVAAAAFAYPGFFAAPATTAQAASEYTVPAGAGAGLCLLPNRQIGEKHG